MQSQDCVLETDASIHGLGTVLSQEGDDGLLHPVVYTSRSLLKPEANYSITELEILTVVWVVMYFHCYLYGCSITVFTVHLAVKAVLETPNPTDKHARWWTCVYGSGVNSGHDPVPSQQVCNSNADALARSPQVVVGQDEAQVSHIQTSLPRTSLQAEPS